MTHPEITQAIALLERDADPQVVNAIRKAKEDGLGFWRLDPQVEQVVGFVHANNSQRAMVVVYLDQDDWELDEEFEDLVFM